MSPHPTLYEILTDHPASTTARLDALEARIRRAEQDSDAALGSAKAVAFALMTHVEDARYGPPRSPEPPDPAPFVEASDPRAGVVGFYRSCPQCGEPFASTQAKLDHYARPCPERRRVADVIQPAPEAVEAPAPWSWSWLDAALVALGAGNALGFGWILYAMSCGRFP